MRSHHPLQAQVKTAQPMSLDIQGLLFAFAVVLASVFYFSYYYFWASGRGTFLPVN